MRSAISCLDRLVGARVLDGERDELGREPQELRVAVAEAAGGVGVDAERADHPVLRPQRCEHRRADAERRELVLELERARRRRRGRGPGSRRRRCGG